MKFISFSLLAIPFLLMGCSKLTVANYDKLKTGLPYEQVVNLLGAPTACDEVLGIKSCRWGDEKHKIIVNFVGEKVVLTSAENIR
jgi:hypothetical protein